MPPPNAMAVPPQACVPCDDSVDRAVWGVVRAFGSVVCAMHGYERNGGSWGWAALWFLFGAWVPVVAVSVACVQRYGAGQWPFPPADLRGRAEPAR